MPKLQIVSKKNIELVISIIRFSLYHTENQIVKNGGIHKMPIEAISIFVCVRLQVSNPMMNAAQPRLKQHYSPVNFRKITAFSPELICIRLLNSLFNGLYTSHLSVFICACGLILSFIKLPRFFASACSITLSSINSLHVFIQYICK